MGRGVGRGATPESTADQPVEGVLRVCERCLYDEAIPGVSFGSDGSCSYCALHDQMDAQYPVGPEGEERLQALVDEMKADGRLHSWGEWRVRLVVPCPRDGSSWCETARRPL